MCGTAGNGGLSGLSVGNLWRITGLLRQTRWSRRVRWRVTGLGVTGLGMVSLGVSRLRCAASTGLSVLLRARLSILLCIWVESFAWPPLR